MSVCLFHPMVAPFVQQAARALHEAGELDRFVTSLRYDPTSRRQGLAIAVAGLAGVDLRRQLQRRRVTELPPEWVESHPWGEILRLLVGRLDRDGRALDFVWQRVESSFDRRVARGLTRDLTGVYGFEYSSLATFRRAKGLGLRVVYDVPAPEPRFVQQILDQELAAFPELVTAWHRWTAAREEQRIARRHAELECADVVIAASQFTRRSFAAAGFDVAKVRIVPYGAPPAITADAVASRAPADARLTFLWAGTFGVRKGAHYLLDAWRALGCERYARLLVFGTRALPERVLHPLPPGIEWRGSVPRSELMAAYEAADALVFPTLCDGFGLVVTEAWSRGLPVITTDCAGAADLLSEGTNGLRVKARDASALVAALAWCLDHRTELRAMRFAARETAAGWQWSDYRRSLTAALAQAGLFSS